MVANTDLGDVVAHGLDDARGLVSPDRWQLSSPGSVKEMNVAMAHGGCQNPDLYLP